MLFPGSSKDVWFYFEMLEKQSLEVFYKKICSQKFPNIHRKTSVLESLFNKVAGLQACNFIKKRYQHRCFPVNISKFSRTSILKNICVRLLVYFEIFIKF